jgi:hypothetical protein
MQHMVALRPWLSAVVLGLVVLAASAGDARVPSQPGRVGVVHAPRAPGLWVWNRNDVAVFAREKAKRPELVPGVLIASLLGRSGELVRRRGLSPARVESDRVAAVVRIEDSVHELWDQSDVYAQLDRELTATLREARATGVEIQEIQLDYDAPARRLRDWARVVKQLARSSLAGVPLWITSIPSHLEDPDYGRSFSGAVVGHELQLFDTGLACTDREQQALADRLSKHQLAFRLGVARFERLNGSAHACWAKAAEGLARLPGYAGTWVFPAGRAASEDT